MSSMHIPHLSLSQPKRTETTQTMKQKSKVIHNLSKKCFETPNLLASSHYAVGIVSLG